MDKVGDRTRRGVPAGPTSEWATWTMGTCLECGATIDTAATPPYAEFTVHITGPGVNVQRPLCQRCARKYAVLLPED